MATVNDKLAQDQEIPAIWQPPEERPERVIFRPLANPYVIPGRGNAPHQIDNDTKAAEYLPKDDFDNQYTYDPNRPDFKQVNPPHPVPVSIISQPYRSELNTTYVVPVLDANLPVPTGLAKFTVDLTNVASLVAYDDTRVNIHIDWTLFNAVSPLNYVAALSRDKSFATYYVPNGPVDITGKDAWYVAPFLLVAQSAFTTNQLPLTALVTTQRTMNVNP